MKILLTGLSGCVGAALRTELSGRGHDVVALVRDASAMQDCGPVSLIEADLTRLLSSDRLPIRIDAVMHFAQSRRYREFPAAASEVFQINTAATLALARYAVDAGASAFVYASSGSVYRAQPVAVGEDDVTEPASFYAASKLAAESILAPFAGLMNVSIHRLFYVYGPLQRGMLTDGLAGRIRSGEPVTLQGQDGITIAPMFSEDVARIACLAVEQGWSGTLNVGNPSRITLRDYASMIGDVLGLAPNFAVTAGNPPQTVLPALDKLSALIDLESFVGPREGLTRMLR